MLKLRNKTSDGAQDTKASETSAADRKAETNPGETVDGVEVEVVTVGWTTPAAPKKPVLFAHLQGTRNGEAFEGMAFSAAAQDFAHQMRAITPTKARIKDAAKIQKYDLSGRGVIVDLDDAIGREKDGKVRYNFKAFRPSGMTLDAYTEALDTMRERHAALFQAPAPTATSDVDDDAAAEMGDTNPDEAPETTIDAEADPAAPQSEADLEAPEDPADDPAVDQDDATADSPAPTADETPREAEATETVDHENAAPEDVADTSEENDGPEAPAEEADAEAESVADDTTQTFAAGDYSEEDYSESTLGLNEAAQHPDEAAGDMVDQAEDTPSADPEPESLATEQDETPVEEPKPEPQSTPTEAAAARPKKTGLKLSLNSKKPKPSEDEESARKPAGMA